MDKVCVILFLERERRKYSSTLFFFKNVKYSIETRHNKGFKFFMGSLYIIKHTIKTNVKRIGMIRNADFIVLSILSVCCITPRFMIVRFGK